MRTGTMDGVVLVTISAVVFSCAGLFVRSVDATAWTIIFWRGVFAAVLTSAFVWQRGSVQREFCAMGGAGVAAALTGALATMAFIPAFKLTTIANVSLIYAVAPFIAAIVMWIWVRERPGRSVLGASVLALIGVLIVVVESIGAANLRGDMLALVMTFMMAIYVCIYRRYPDTPAAGPAVLMSLFLLPVALIFGRPLSISGTDFLIVACFGGIFSIASVTLAEGSRRLPAAHTTLLSAVETPLAPVWAWLLLSELPALSVVIGGVIIMVAVIGSVLCGPGPSFLKRPKTKQKRFCDRTQGVGERRESH